MFFNKVEEVKNLAWGEAGARKRFVPERPRARWVRLYRFFRSFFLVGRGSGKSANTCNAARRAKRVALWGQATKCMWWMPWRSQAMKDVAACVKLRGAGKRALIRRCPNGETRPEEGHFLAEHIGWEGRTRRTETSQYPQEKKSTEIPRVVASESGAAGIS